MQKMEKMHSHVHVAIYLTFFAAHVSLCLCRTEGEEIHIDLNNVIHVTDEKFIGVTIDSGILRRHWENFDPKSKKLQTLASALSPCYLRVGGNDADFLIFDEDAKSLDPVPRHLLNSPESVHTLTWKKGEQSSASAYWNTDKGKNVAEFQVDKGTITNFTMSAKMYDQLHSFVSKVGWLLIFDLNVLLRKEGHWDPANALQLMEYTVKKGYQMAGWELGNEPDNFNYLIGNYTLPPEKLVVDYKTLLRTLQKFPQFTGGLILGPSVAQLSVDWRIAYFDRFLKSGGAEVVTAATFHQYYIDAVSATIEKFTDPDILNVLIKEVEYGVNLTRASGSKAKVCLGETSSAWGGGAKGLSDGYVAAFMWLDKLGITSAGGVDVIIRQSFYGYNYSLVDNDSFKPLPDYWLTLLYKLLVGNKVLKVIAPINTGRLRAYAHCAATERSGYKAGSVVLYVMNLLNEDQNLTFPEFPASTPLHVYNMEPAGGDLTSKTVLLNGKPLQMVNNSTLPNLLRPVKTQAPVTIKAFRYSFIVFPEAQAAACL